MTSQLEASIVRVYSQAMQVVGLGFMVSDKHILTCAHVVVQSLKLLPGSREVTQSEISIDFPFLLPGQLSIAVVSFLETEKDVALLEIKLDPPIGTQSANLVIASDLWNHPFRSLGFPKQFPEGIWVHGNLLGRLANSWIQIDSSEVGLGFSGAPVWDEQLNGVVGMIVAIAGREKTRTSFAITTDELVRVWPDLAERVIQPNPYRGLSIYEESDSPFFFGREIFVEKLMKMIYRQSAVVVVGPAGSGKSSVILAGLFPKLRKQKNWLLLYIRPTNQPIQALASLLTPIIMPKMSELDLLVAAKELADRLENGHLDLRNVLAQILKTNKKYKQVLMVVDQLEEVYTLCGDQEIIRKFFNLLLDPLNYLQGKRKEYTLLTAIRVEYLGLIAADRHFAEIINSATIFLPPMGRQEMESALLSPAKLAGLSFDAGLVNRILNDFGYVNNLSYLQMLMNSLWNLKKGE